jgi:transcriptional regulator with XRE-family HTH domain
MDKIQIHEAINKMMKERKVTRAELARRMKVSRSEVTQMLQSSRNLTVAKMVQIADAIGCRLEIRIKSSEVL